MAFCSSCGTQFPAGAAACPNCGGAQPVSAYPAGASTQPGGLTDNVAGALAYVTIIPAILFLILAPYNRNRFVRFHALQCIFFAIAWAVLWVLLGMFVHIPLLGWASALLWPLIWLAGFILWLVLVFKAYQGQKFKLPVIGDIAEQQANSV